MTRLFLAYDDVCAFLSAKAADLLPLLARLIFALVLAGYFWSSALTKFDGPFSPSVGAYAQIFPRAFEAANYNPQAFGLWQWVVVMAGAYAELVLPLLLIFGLLTRIASLGMIGFIVVQSLTDIVGHGADAATIGRWFDRVPDALILDQRALWMGLLAVTLIHGGGRISIDAALRKWRSTWRKPASN